jgi:hypothetical protein
MSVQAMAWVWQHSQAEGTARLVLLAIADRVNKRGVDAWPSQQRLAEKCRISERTVRRVVDELVALRELEVEKYRGPMVDGKSGRRTHRYSLPKLADSLSGNPEEVGGQRVEVVGQMVGVVGHPCPGNRPFESSFEPSARREALGQRLFEGLRHNNKRVDPRECQAVVDQARAANLADHIIDECIGMALERGAQFPSYFAKIVQRRCPTMPQGVESIRRAVAAVESKQRGMHDRVYDDEREVIA